MKRRIYRHGIPSDVVELWKGNPVKHGLILISDLVMGSRNGRIVKIKNPELIPSDAKQLGAFKTPSGNTLYLIRVE